MTNSERFLCQRLTSLLSKHNCVPMIQPPLGYTGSEYRSIPNVIHVWDYQRPVFLSFCIGQCKGKTSLVNSLCYSAFEQTKNDRYFSATIDVDFGYHFDKRRPINIADAHWANSLWDYLSNIDGIQWLYHSCWFNLFACESIECDRTISWSAPSSKLRSPTHSWCWGWRNTTSSSSLIWQSFLYPNITVCQMSSTKARRRTKGKLMKYVRESSTTKISFDARMRNQLENTSKDCSMTPNEVSSSKIRLSSIRFGLS